MCNSGDCPLSTEICDTHMCFLIHHHLLLLSRACILERTNIWWTRSSTNKVQSHCPASSCGARLLPPWLLHCARIFPWERRQQNLFFLVYRVSRENCKLKRGYYFKCSNTVTSKILSSFYIEGITWLIRKIKVLQNTFATKVTSDCCTLLIECIWCVSSTYTLKGQSLYHGSLFWHNLQYKSVLG